MTSTSAARAPRRSARSFRSPLQAVTAAAERAPELQVEEQACLWACRSHCTVYLAQGGKPAYLAGTFTPTAEAAEAIVDFARRYAASPDGAVPYRDWPEGMKGHFIARLPQDACLARLTFP